LYEDLKRDDDGLFGEKEAYEYDADGNKSSEAYYRWNTSTDNWRGYEKRTFHEKDASDNLIVVINYRWDVDQWVKDSYYIHYPDADQTAPIVLKPVELDVTENSYAFDLESLLLPSLTGYGEVTYTVGTIIDDYNIVGDINYTGGTTLLISFNRATPLRSTTLPATIPITITSANYGEFLATLLVTKAGDTDIPPIPVPVPVSGVSLNTSKIELAIDGTFQLAATVSPANADNQSISWFTSDPAIATVTNNGKVTAIAPGTATITVSTYDGDYTANCTIVVTDNSVGTEQISQELIVFFNESALTIDSPLSETIAVYNFNGQLLFADKKPQGKTVFTNINFTGEKMVIVKGSSGWIKKLIF
jgi:hypothetical protein